MKTKFKETGLLVGLNIEDEEIVSNMFEEAIDLEKSYFTKNKPFILPFIRNVFDKNKNSYYRVTLNTSSIVSYLYENNIFLENLNFFKNLDYEAEFYNLCARDFLNGIKNENKILKHS